MLLRVAGVQGILYDYPMRVVGCFLEFGDKFVILHRHAHKPDGDTWGLPSGKVESGESDEAAMLRELEEETGYKALPTELHYLGDHEFSDTTKPYTFVAYRIALVALHEVVLEETAHSAYTWVTADECNAREDLIPDFHELLRIAGYV